MYFNPGKYVIFDCRSRDVEEKLEKEFELINSEKCLICMNANIKVYSTTELN